MLSQCVLMLGQLGKVVNSLTIRIVPFPVWAGKNLWVFSKPLSYGGVTHRRRKRQLEMPENLYHTRCFSRAVESMHGQEDQTGCKVQGQAVKELTLNPLKDTPAANQFPAA